MGPSPSFFILPESSPICVRATPGVRAAPAHQQGALGAGGQLGEGLGQCDRWGTKGVGHTPNLGAQTRRKPPTRLLVFPACLSGFS